MNNGLQSTTPTMVEKRSAAQIIPVGRPGRGPSDNSVIALHSSGANGGQWRAYARTLPEEVVLHTPNLLGYGTTSLWPAEATLTLDDEAQRLAPLLRETEAPVHVVGHSYGGAVALQLALRWPTRVRSLTLYEPARFALLREQHRMAWREIRNVADDVAELVLTGRAAQAAERFVDYWGTRGSFAAMPEAAQQRVAERMGKVRAEFGALFGDFMTPTAFSALRVPLRLLVGTRSPAPALRASEVLASACPHATLLRLSGAVHLTPVQDPMRILPLLPFGGSTSWPLAA